MKKFKELINETNENRIKQYFNLTQLSEITGLGTRALKYRMLQVKEKYKDVPALLKKEGRNWNIHYTIINEFLPKYKTSNTTIYNFDWKSMCTWNTKFNYDFEYHKQIITEIKQELPNTKIIYAIEQDGRGINHVHLIADVLTDIVFSVTQKVLGQYMDIPTDCRIQTSTVLNRYSIIEYVKKATNNSGVL